MIKQLFFKSIRTFKDYPKQKDHVVKGFSVKKNFRITFVDNTTSLQTSVDKFKLTDERQINLLGNCFSTSLMISSLLKGEERIKAIVSFEDLEQNAYDFYAESMANGEIRGFSIKNKNENQYYEPFFKVGKVLYGYQQESFSMLGLDYNEKQDWVKFSGKQVQEFYQKSDQILNLCDLHTTTNGSQQYPNKTTQIEIQSFLKYFSRVQRSFGYMLQKMPDAHESYLEQLHEDLINSDIYKQIKNDRLNYSQVKDLLEQKFNIDDLQLTRYPVDFYCRCCKENFLKLLVRMGVDTLTDMQKKNERTLNCIYCNTNYNIEDKDFEQLIKDSTEIEKTTNAKQTVIPNGNNNASDK